MKITKPAEEYADNQASGVTVAGAVMPNVEVRGKTYVTDAHIEFDEPQMIGQDYEYLTIDGVIYVGVTVVQHLRDLEYRCCVSVVASVPAERKPPKDFWEYEGDMSITAEKLRALGISENFIKGDVQPLSWWRRVFVFLRRMDKLTLRIGGSR